MSDPPIEFHDDAERYPKTDADQWAHQILNALGEADASHQEKLHILLAYANTEHQYAVADGEIPSVPFAHVAKLINENIEEAAKQFGADGFEDIDID